MLCVALVLLMAGAARGEPKYRTDYRRCALAGVAQARRAGAGGADEPGLGARSGWWGPPHAAARPAARPPATRRPR